MYALHQITVQMVCMTDQASCKDDKAATEISSGHSIVSGGTTTMYESKMLLLRLHSRYLMDKQGFWLKSPIPASFSSQARVDAGFPMQGTQERV